MAEGHHDDGTIIQRTFSTRDAACVFADELLDGQAGRFGRIDMTELKKAARESLPDAATAREIVDSLINICSSKLGSHYEYDGLAGSLFLHLMYADTPERFSDAMRILHADRQVSDQVWEAVCRNRDAIDAAVCHERDHALTFFGLKTLQRGYLLTTSKGAVVERPQHLFMRVAVGIHGLDMARALETYELISTKHMIHATPTLFNAGTRHPQMSSCFLLQMPSDSLDHIFDTLKNCGMISKHAGGIGLALHSIRAKGSPIKSCNGTSSGIIPMLRMFNACSRYVNQAGKRNGSMAIYLEPWHADMDDFLELRKNYGNEEQRTRDLFTALWVPDLFMKRVEQDGVWSLMSPDTSPGLHKVWGDEFVALYEGYERRGAFVKQIRARDLWARIIESQLETGLPYMLYKDAANGKSNQQHLGTIQCSNLCTEIIEWTGKNEDGDEETSVCNLGSIGLPAFVAPAAGGGRGFDFEKLHRVTRVMTRNLDNVIDLNMYPIEGARISNMRHRPIGIGIQGLADVFAMLDLPFDSPEARQLNVQIFETMYHGAVTESVQLAKEKGAYKTFPGSPASEGRLQFDLWGHAPSDRYDWAALKADVRLHGMRNSLLLAPMPTASTSQILGYNECFEPFTSAIFRRSTLAGEFVVACRLLIEALERDGLWSEEMKTKIIRNNGSIQSIEEIPAHVRAVFKNVWEIKQRSLIDMAADRGPFICQSQSLNLFMEEPDYQKMSAMHFHGWKRGIKTSSYYLRSRPKAKAQQFAVEPVLACTKVAGCVTCSA
jgi:ribonucleoside-diphosphate reductase alpha subunit